MIQTIGISGNIVLLTFQYRCSLQVKFYEKGVIKLHAKFKGLNFLPLFREATSILSLFEKHSNELVYDGYLRATMVEKLLVSQGFVKTENPNGTFSFFPGKKEVTRSSNVGANNQICLLEVKTHKQN